MVDVTIDTRQIATIEKENGNENDEKLKMEKPCISSSIYISFHFELNYIVFGFYACFCFLSLVVFASYVTNKNYIGYLCSQQTRTTTAAASAA